MVILQTDNFHLTIAHVLSYISNTHRWNQTKDRLMDYDLHLQRGVGVEHDDTQLPRVKVYKAVVGKKQDGEIAALKERIRRNPKTLFVCIQDECHFGLTAKGMHRFYHRKQ